MHYRKIWEEYNNLKIPEGYEIHHIDGNHFNDDPTNLQLVTIQEHLEIHKKQNDWGAVQAILLRINGASKEEIKNAASLSQKKIYDSGNHNFQKMSKERRSEISTQAAYKTVKNKVGIHAINADPILARKNAQRAGLVAKERCAGFLDTTSNSHGSKAVQNTIWWVNPEGKRKRSKVSPGSDWVAGMVYRKE